MKRLFLLILITLSSFLYADHNWTAIKFGYGNETAGIGLATETRIKDFGFILGAGVPDGRLGASITTKYYFSTHEEQSFFITLGYGMLGFMINDLGLDVFETSYVYGPYIMLGNSAIWNQVFGDYTLGFGYSFVDNEIVLTAQASLGFIIHNF